MRIHVRHFSILREQRGCAHEEVETEEGTTAEMMYLQLFPPGPDGALPVLYAIDAQYVEGDAPLTEGCELVFVPALGGG